MRKTFNDGSLGVLVHAPAAHNAEGAGARARQLSPDTAELTVLPASGTFSAYITIDRETAAELGAWLTDWSNGQVHP